MSVTITQIAERVGVSTSTVARVLRGDVKGAQERSAKKAKEILKLSEELGYQPNWRARALSRGKTQTIGLLYSEPKWIFEDPMNEIAISFTRTLQELNYDLRLIPVTPSSDWKELVYGSAVDGLAFLLHVPEEAKEVVESCRLPTILLGDRLGDAANVGVDDVAGGYLATRHLLGLGHKKITFFVAEQIRPHISIGERREGYERAMREAGLEDQISVWHCDIDDVMTRLLGEDPPTAIIGYCHIEAMQVTHAAWAHGLSVPSDLSLIAFNDMAAMEYMTPPLTVAGFDTAALGRTGAQMLISQITDPGATPSESVLLRHKLVVRGTTSAPATRVPGSGGASA